MLGNRKISVRKSLIALTVIAILPISILVVLNHYNNYKLKLSEIQAEIHRVSEISTSHISEVVASSKQTLITISNLDQIKNRDISKSENIFKSIVANSKYFNNIGICDENGIGLTSALSSNNNLNYDDRTWFLRAKNGTGMYLGDYQIGKITKKPGISLATHIHSSLAKDTYIYLALNLKEIQNVISNTKLPAGCILNLIDRNGVVVARNPESEIYVGRKSKAWPAFQARNKDAGGFVETEGVDGEVRLYNFVEVPGADAGLFIGVAASKSYYSDIMVSQLVKDIGLLLLSLICALFAASWIGGYLIVLPIKNLHSLSRRLSKGELISDFEDKGGAYEIKALLYSFKEMYEAVQLHTNHLEDLVIERTYDLEQRNEQLNYEISERTKTELALQESESNYRNLFESVDEIILIVNQQKIIKANDKAESLLSSNQGTLINKIAIDYVHPDDVDSVRLKTESIRTGYYYSGFNEVRIKLKNGEYIWVMYNIVRINWHGEDCLLCLLTDINERVLAVKKIESLNEELESKVIDRTASLNEALAQIEETNLELKQMNENIWEDSLKLQELNEQLAKSESELIRANQAKDKFLSIIAHDLKNPVGGLKLLLETIVFYFDNISPTEVKSMLNTALLTSGSLNDLLENLLQWAFAQKGDMIFVPQIVNVFEVAHKIAKTLHLNAESKSIKLSILIDTNHNIYGDPNYIDAIVRNLLSNAIKYTPASGEIRIEFSTRKNIAQQHGLYGVLSVSDSGIGMKPQDLDNLFRIEKRFTTPGTNKEKGSGLGLILCKEFVEKHGGVIWAESVYGEGSTFFVAFPERD